MHVMISIDDQADGVPSVQTLTHPVIVGDMAPITPATELAAFLMRAAAEWLDAKEKDAAVAHQFVQSLVRPAETQH